MTVPIGRPRLDSTKSFRADFAMLLPSLRAGEISKGEMARRLNISHRSLNRLLEAGAQCVPTVAKHHV